jgi:hypothetical protein
MSQERDCNTCAHHKQGVHPQKVVLLDSILLGKVTCSDCLRNEFNCWAPKKASGPEADPKTPGAKLDLGKAPVVRGCIKYFPRAVRAVAMLSLHGANKYTWNGWEKVPDGINRYDDAIGRHMVGEVIDGEFDPEWLEQDKEVLHATAVAWNALARLDLILRDKS